MLWLCYKSPSGLFGNTRDMSVMHEKAKFVCFNHMQPHLVKFKSVQINMKHVSYYQWGPNESLIKKSNIIRDKRKD